MSTGVLQPIAALQPIAFIDLTGDTPKEIDIIDLTGEDSDDSSSSLASSPAENLPEGSDDGPAEDSDDNSSEASDGDSSEDSNEDLDSIPLPPPTEEIERNIEDSAVDSIPLPHPTGGIERRMEDSDVASIPLPPPSGAIKRKLEDSAPLVSKKAHELVGLEGSDEDALFEAEFFIQKLNELKNNEEELGKIHQVLDQLVIDIVKPISQMKMVENQWMQEQLKIIFEKNFKIQQKLHIQIEIKKTEVLNVKEQIKMEQKRRWDLLNAIDPETYAVFVEADEGAGSDIPTNRAELAELAARIEKVTKKSSRIQALDKRINACRISIDNCFRAKNHYATIEMKLEETNQEIDVLKEENSRLQKVIEEMDKSIKAHKKKLEKLKDNMRGYRNLAERFAGTVVDHTCPICLDEFHGPTEGDKSPRFLPGCGHTFCLSCVRKMRVFRYTQCQICRAACSFANLNRLPINYNLNK